jgi:hypothetical protein
MAGVAAFVVVTLAVGVTPAHAQSDATLNIATASGSHVFITDPLFLGVNIDSASLTNKIDLTDPYLTNMAAQIAAAAGSGAITHLRVGGSASNGLIYIPDGVPGRGGPGVTVIVTDASLKALNDFALAAGLRITFCFGYQTTDGKWDSSINATALWKMVAAKNLTAFSGWSLGNEIIGKEGFDVKQYADDYVAFRAAVTSTAPSWAQDIVGPSAAGAAMCSVKSVLVYLFICGAFHSTAGWPGVPPMQTFLTTNANTDKLSISIHAYSFGECTIEEYMNKV